MKKNHSEITVDTRKDIIADMHTHSEHSHDSICPIADMAEQQIAEGTSVFAVTDHCDMEYLGSVDVEGIIRASVADAEKQNREIEGVEILRGIEICECFWNQEATDRILAQNEYDVIIGSVHTVLYKDYAKPYALIDFGKLGAKKSAEFLNSYFDDMIKMINSTDFDILAHLTCPLRYINGKYGLNIDCKNYKEKIEKILGLIIKKNIALEINTSCKGSLYDEFMPEEWIVKRYREMGGFLITLGSDAHISANASHSFKAAIKMLKANGFKNIYYYKNRKIYSCEI